MVIGFVLINTAHEHEVYNKLCKVPKVVELQPLFGEITARGPKIIAIADEGDTDIDKHADFVLRFPSGSGPASCVPIIIILQLLAYNVANLRGCSIDKPRNLAKSVTVE